MKQPGARAATVQRSVAPTQASGRVESLDVLRGFAVLGIYVVNIHAFAMIPHAYQNPFLAETFAPAAQSAAKFVAIAFEGKFIVLFSALFGAGVAMMVGSGEEARRLGLHRRRMGWLLAIGMVHAFALWFGDILVTYAIGGLVLTSALAWSTTRLAWVGAALIGVSAAIFALVALGVATMPAEEYAELAAESWALSPEAAESWRRSLTSGWLERLPLLASFTFETQVNTLVIFGPRILGVMMLGAALYRSGFFTGGWSGARLALAAALAPFGLIASWLATEISYAARFDFVESAPGTLLDQAASVIQALGYAALVMLACRVPWLALARKPFAAAGRMAITNYLGCTVFSVLWFYGPPGLGKLGSLDHAGQLALALIVCAAMLAISTAWLAVFRFGPVEWAWRSATYGRIQPFLKSFSSKPS